MVVVEVEVAQQGVACKVGREAGHAGMWPGRQNTPGAATLTCTPQLPDSPHTACTQHTCLVTTTTMCGM